MPRRIRVIAPLVLLLSLVGACAFAATPVHPTAADIAALAGVGDLRLAPDGHAAVVALTTHVFDAAAKPSADDHDAGWTNARQLWLVDLATGATRALTTAKERAGTPRWSPDGREIAFLRKREGTTRIQVMRLDGGEAEVVDTGTLEPGSLEWTPDGRSFVFGAAEPKSQKEKDAEWASGGVEEWDTEWRATAVYVVPRAGGVPRRVTKGPEHVADWALAPDGARLAVQTSESSDPYLASTLVTVRIVSMADGRVLRTLTDGTHSVDQLRWSPDGRRVAFLTVRDGLTLQNSLMLCDAEGTGARELSPSLDPAFDRIEWAPDGQSVVALIRERTGTALWRIAAAGGTPQDLGFSGRVIDGDFALARDGARVVCLSSSDTEPPDPTVFDLATRAVRVVARLHPQTSTWAVGATEVVRWTGPEGTALEGLLTLPPAAAHAPSPPPLVVFPHGGPDDVTPRRFSAFTVFLAAHGYAVFRPNYRGGVAYGHAFYAANRDRFGALESMDIESGVDALIAARRVDPNNLFFGGWSWGGYISAWTLGHVHRYRAHVVGAGVNDVVLSYALSDINHGVAAQWEYRGDPWHQTEHFDRANPIRAIAGARAPTLILQGQEDARVPFQQSILLYRALRDVGCPVTFYAYPREDHGFVEPAHNAHRWQAWLDWYDHHRGARGSGAPGTAAGAKR